MKGFLYGLIFIIFLISEGCIEKFTPEIHGTLYFPVVNGLITNQPEVYTIKLFWSKPVLEKTNLPISGCTVTVHDDLGHICQFTESSVPGTYNSDKTSFQGEVGRIYTLHIETNNATPSHYSFESVPVEMKAVPPIDSLFHEKIIIKEATPNSGKWEGCQIYLNTYDPNGICSYFRWDYTETWKIQIPYYYIENQICWVSNRSNNIIIKSTLNLSEDRLYRYPILTISNETDRLRERYSIIVNQYSLSEEEFNFWDKISRVTQDVGSLYDIIPNSISGNMFCIEDPGEQVLGYFSVSARTSKRIYVDEIFSGLINPYKDCPGDKYMVGDPIPGLNVYRWIIDVAMGIVLTTWDHRCADCTVRGTKIKPEFWEDYK